MSRILTLDIETSPHDVWSFNVWKTNIAPVHIKEPTKMLTWAAKFHDHKRIYYKTFRDDDFLSTLHDLLDQTDIIVTFNGDKFDLPHVNREFLAAGFAPPRPLSSIDLLTVVRRRFKFPHNRLDYVASVILGESKLETGGFELWPAFMAGDSKAKRVMKRYNIGDVRLTERLYAAVKPWITNHPYTGEIPFDFIDDSAQDYTCPACDARAALVLRRPRRTRCFAIRLIRCTACGTWAEGKRRKI